MNILETERLLLRKFTKDDMGPLFLLLKDEAVNRFLPWFPLRSLEETERFYEDRFAQGYAYAICLKKDNIPIGYVQVSMDDSHDFGYGLAILSI